MTQLLFLLLAACASEPVPAPAPEAADPSTAPAAAEPSASVEPARVTALKTRDGVILEADQIVGAKGAPTVVLVHMIPPHHDRTGWPVDFVSALGSRGWHVVNVDRRGAGGSGGVAEQAYKGETGRYDVEAAVRAAQAVGAGEGLAVLGASNGTTSMIDYAVWAESQSLPVPVFLGFLTGGGYTESQTKVAQVAGIPALFLYSTEEREWSAAQRGKGSEWTFLEYPEGAHGTKLFGAVGDQVRADLLAALDAQLGGSSPR